MKKIYNIFYILLLLICFCACSNYKSHYVSSAETDNYVTSNLVSEISTSDNFDVDNPITDIVTEESSTSEELFEEQMDGVAFIPITLSHSAAEQWLSEDKTTILSTGIHLDLLVTINGYVIEGDETIAEDGYAKIYWFMDRNHGGFERVFKTVIAVEYSYYGTPYVVFDYAPMLSDWQEFELLEGAEFYAEDYNNDGVDEIVIITPDEFRGGFYTVVYKVEHQWGSVRLNRIADEYTEPIWENESEE